MTNSQDLEWNPVGDGTPLGAWLETRREGEAGTNVCMCRLLHIGDEPEWIERGYISQITDAPVPGRTTVTHSTFLPPTHWRWPVEDAGITADGESGLPPLGPDWTPEQIANAQERAMAPQSLGGFNGEEPSHWMRAPKPPRKRRS